MKIEEPDETTDVIVEFIRELDPAGGSIRPFWNVWVGDRCHLRFTDRVEAIDEGKRTATAPGLRAWLSDGKGYPLKRLDA